MVVDSIAMNLG